MNRRTLISIGFALPLVIGMAALALAIAQPAHTAGPLLYPDLAWPRSRTLPSTTPARSCSCAFSATIVNVGTGPIEFPRVKVQRGGPGFDVRSVPDSGGDSVLQPTGGAQLVWGGDGHSHWHIRDLENDELDRLDNGSKVGTGEKSGFCFFDTTQFRLTLPGAPSAQVYTPGSVSARTIQRRRA